MYLIIYDVGSSATSSRAFEVFHDGVDVTELRAAGEEKVHRRGEGPPEKRAAGKENTEKLNSWL